MNKTEVEINRKSIVFLSIELLIGNEQKYQKHHSITKILALTLKFLLFLLYKTTVLLRSYPFAPRTA